MRYSRVLTKLAATFVLVAGFSLGNAAGQSALDFSCSLFKEVAKADKADVVFVSPMSASMALSLAANGAGGNTLEQMLSVLAPGTSLEQLNEYNRRALELYFADGADGIEIKMANSLWLDKGFKLKKPFKKTAKKEYASRVSTLDFSSSKAVGTINRWCSKNTSGRIDKLLESIEPNTVMYILNALYFNCEWTEPFKPESTREAVFHGTDGETEAMFMSRTGDYRSFTDEQVCAVELPYGRTGQYAMDVLMPSEGESLEDFIARLDADSLERMLSGMRMGDVRLKLPKFKAEYETSLNSVLQTLGMTDAFSSAADFSNLSEGRLMISQVKQKTFIEVNERGTEAAAITSIGVMKSSLPMFKDITVDRPFVFLIRDSQSGTVLFMGAVRNLH